MEREIILEIIDDSTQGVDVYHNNGSMWLIFTDSKKWVIELTKEGTLWYNYYFFKDCYKYLSLDVVENQHYITEWVESVIQNGVKSTQGFLTTELPTVESVIQNGVKSTLRHARDLRVFVESVIQNGVKDTFANDINVTHKVEKTKAMDGWVNSENILNKVIQNGIKHTSQAKAGCRMSVENTIKHGIKYTEYGDWLDGDKRFDNIIQNGIKETNPHFLEIINPTNFEPVINEMKRLNEVNIVLEKGIKETIELPDKSGELRGYGDYYNRQEDRTKPHHQYVDDVICNSVKETNWRKVDNFPDYVDRIIK